MGRRGIIHSQGHSHHLTLTPVVHMEVCHLLVLRPTTRLGLRLRPSLGSIFQSGLPRRVVWILHLRITLIYNPLPMVPGHQHRNRVATGTIHRIAHSRHGPGHLRLSVLAEKVRSLGDIRTPPLPFLLPDLVRSHVALTLCTTLSLLMRPEGTHPQHRPRKNLMLIIITKRRRTTLQTHDLSMTSVFSAPNTATKK